MNAMKMAMPPRRAVGLLCHLSSLGLAINPVFLAPQMTHGVSRLLIPKEHVKTRAVLRKKGVMIPNSQKCIMKP